ncbi:MAG TPA: hypothetical protein VGQ76_19050 [Thermoanaerobaculia bacterium]|jgi:hypothetical protein|nr:hypothetical protein [Thermoanaerobaculia bacterium]
MKRILLAVLLIAATAVVADDLVDAAKTAKAKRKKSTTKVITNADVKKAKSTLIENKLEPLPETAALPKEGMLDKQARERREKQAADVKVAAARTIVAGFEKELVTIEQQYYETNDLNRRDTELVRRFNDVKAKLDVARKELEALTPPPPPSQTTTVN